MSPIVLYRKDFGCSDGWDGEIQVRARKKRRFPAPTPRKPLSLNGFGCFLMTEITRSRFPGLEDWTSQARFFHFLTDSKISIPSIRPSGKIEYPQKEKVPETAMISRTFRAFQPSEWRDSNSRPRHPKCRTLPTGLHPDRIPFQPSAGTTPIIPETGVLVKRRHGFFPALRISKICLTNTS